MRLNYCKVVVKIAESFNKFGKKKYINGLRMRKKKKIPLKTKKKEKKE